jgi:hypothetical protein
MFRLMTERKIFLYTHNSRFIAITFEPSFIPAIFTLVTGKDSFLVLTPSEDESRFGPSSKRGGIGVTEWIKGGTLFPAYSGWGGTSTSL